MLRVAQRVGSCQVAAEAVADQDHLPQAQLLPPLGQRVQEEVLRLLPRFGREPRPACSRPAASLWRNLGTRLYVLVPCSYFAKATSDSDASFTQSLREAEMQLRQWRQVVLHLRCHPRVCLPRG